MDKQLLDDTITYIRKQLTGIHENLTWADGAQADGFRTRQTRLLAELDRLESLRIMIGPVGPMPLATPAPPTISGQVGV